MYGMLTRQGEGRVCRLEMLQLKRSKSRDACLLNVMNISMEDVENNCGAYIECQDLDIEENWLFIMEIHKHTLEPP